MVLAGKAKIHGPGHNETLYMYFSSHWCCRVDLGVISKNVTVQKVIYVQKVINVTVTTGKLVQCAPGQKSDLPWILNIFKNQCHKTIIQTRYNRIIIHINSHFLCNPCHNIQL